MPNVLSDAEFQNYGAPPSGVLTDEQFRDYGAAPKLQSNGIPEGYELEEPATNAGLPPGFELETPPPAKPTGAFDYVNPSVGKAVSNIPGSAAQFAENTIQPFVHPQETLENIKNLGLGVLQKIGAYPGTEHEKYADAVGAFFAGRYGSLDKARQTFEQDPVGLAGDLSLFLTGGGSAAARLPGTLGKVGEVARTVGSTIDPLNAVAPIGRAAGKVAGKTATSALGVTTGVGAQPIEMAARSGFEGGEAGEAFRGSMRGEVPMADVVDEARGAIRQMRQERGAAYRSGMADIGADTTVLDFNKINQALDDAQKIQTYKGQSLSPSTHDIRGEMRHVINQWETFDPQQFHTPEGIDALKRKLGDIRDGTQFGTPERAAANTIYGAVRQAIIDQAPAYGSIMKGYEQASTLVKNLERELSLNPNANVDTALRKLQSVLRDNVATSYGRRRELANYLVNAGAPNLLEKLAGQSMHSWEPRGLARVLAGGELAGALVHPAAAPGIAASLAAASPRLVGEAVHGAGRAARLGAPVAGQLARPARQFGQATQASPFANQGNPFAP